MEQAGGEEPTLVPPPKEEGAPPAEKPWRKPVIWHLAVAQFLSILAISLTVPVVPLVWSDTPAAGGDSVKGASLQSLSEFINGACELFSSALLGVLSDRVGRKPFMLLACVGQLVELVVSALVCNDRTDYSLHLQRGAAWLTVAKGFGGLCGNVATFTKAYVGDVSTAGDCARNFAVLLAMIGVAFVIGPPIGAIVSKGHLQAPFLISSVLITLDICWVALLQESLRPEHRVAFQWRKANPLGALQFLLSRHFLTFFACMAFLDQFSLTILRTLLLQYSRIVFGVDQLATSMLLVVFGVGQGVAFALVLRPLVRWRGEASAMKLGYVLTCVAFASLALFSYVPVFWLTFIAMVVFALGAISNPTQTSIASRAVDKNEQGRLQAANACLDIVGKMVGSLASFAIFKPTAQAGQPGVVWWFASGVMLVGVALSFQLARLLPKHLRASAYQAEGSNSSLPEEGEEEEEEEEEANVENCRQQVQKSIVPGGIVQQVQKSIVPGGDVQKSGQQTPPSAASPHPSRCEEGKCCLPWPFQ